MNSDNSNGRSYLDQIRINEGTEKCRKVLNDSYRKNIRQAAVLLNDRRLTFPCLYNLRDQLETLHIQGYLNQRNIIAMRIVNQLKGSGTSEADYLSSKRSLVYSVLTWMFETGFAEDIPEDLYEEVLDVTVSVLITVYGDRGIFPTLVELIFTRNRKERYIHDLVWALFQIHDPGVLKLIAERILSSEPKDTILAAQLLNIDETEVPDKMSDKQKLYTEYLCWLEENEPYLYFTEESFQCASRPAFCAVDLERKYLQEAVSSYDRQPVASSDQALNTSLAAFKVLSGNDQKILSEYSSKIHDKSIPAWKEWLQTPVGEQMRAALGNERAL